MQRTHRSTIGAVAALGAAACVLAACSTQVDGRATASGAPSEAGSASTSARETAREPVIPSRAPSTTTAAVTAPGPAELRGVLDAEVPPTVTDVKAFVDALDTPDADDDTTTADTAVGVIGATGPPSAARWARAASTPPVGSPVP